VALLNIEEAAAIRKTWPRNTSTGSPA